MEQYKQDENLGYNEPDKATTLYEMPKTAPKEKREILGPVLGILMAGIVGIFFGLFTYYAFLVPVEIKNPVVYCEYGSSISTSLHDYVVGNDFNTWVTTIDFSEVDETKVGIYDVYVAQGYYKMGFQVVVQDTTAPEVVIKDKDFYLQNGYAYDLAHFVESTYDLSGDVQMDMSVISVPEAVEGNGAEQWIAIYENGKYRIAIAASDIYGNETEALITVIVDTPPEIHNTKEFYIAEGYTVDYTKDILVKDEADGYITDYIIDDSAVNLTEAGTYEVVYTATDSYGFTTSVNVPVYVDTRLEIQELINTHQIDRYSQHIAGAYNLYDFGVYAEDNVDFICEALEPAIVVIHQGDSRGSGFIVEINDEEMIICTNLHVTDNAESLLVFCHDGICFLGETVGSMEGIDVSFVTVKRDRDNELYMNDLMTVHIDKGYVDSITNPKSVEVGFRTLNEDGTVWKDKSGYIVEINQSFKYPDVTGIDKKYIKNLKYVTQVTAQLFAGCSGSAIFDGHGNLIGMATMHITPWGGKTEYYAMTLDDILAGFEQVFGRQLNYQ